MKSTAFKKQHRQLANGRGMYGRQWVVKSSVTLGSETRFSRKIFMPVYL